MRATLSIAAVLATSLLAACGGDDDEPTEPTEASAALEACLDYREAVTAVRFDAEPADQAEDFQAVADAAAAASDATEEADLIEGGTTYVTQMGDLADTYGDAVKALEKDNQLGFLQALDFAEPADDSVNGLAARGGLEECALPVPEDDEQGFSQSGFPALVLPGDAISIPPDEGFAAYELSDEQAILLERGPQLETGTVPIDEAATRFDEEVGEMRNAEEVGDAGPGILPMREYTFDDGSSEGRLFVFSGQGYLWILQCANRIGGEPVPTDVCDRTVDSAGFLMF